MPDLLRHRPSYRFYLLSDICDVGFARREITTAFIYLCLPLAYFRRYFTRGHSGHADFGSVELVAARMGY